MLCDDVLRLSVKPIPGLEPQHRYLQRLATLVRGAERFVLTDEVVDLLYNVQETRPSNIMAALPVCRLPFKTLFIEYDSNYRHAVQTEYGYNEIAFPPEQKVKTGLLLVATDDSFVRGSAYEVNNTGKFIMVSPFRMDFDLTPDPDANLVLRSLDPITSTYTVRIPPWGQLNIGPTSHPRQNRYTDGFKHLAHEVEALRHLSIIFRLGIDADAIPFLLHLTGGDEALIGSITRDWEGDKRFIIAMLIAMNSRNCLDVERRALRDLNHNRSFRVKPALVTHNVVRVKLSKLAENRHRTGRGTGDVPWHKVRGHWKLRKTGIYFWRPHARGNPESGARDHLYRVVP